MQDKYNTILTQSSVMNLVVKAGTIGLDSLKLIALVKTGGALLPFLVDIKDESPKVFTNQLSQAMSELRDELSQKDHDDHLTDLQGKVKDGGVEAFKSTIELYKSSPDITLAKIGKKLKDRYNLFDNEDEVKDKLLAEIIKYRDKQAKALDQEIKFSIKDKAEYIQTLSRVWGIDSAVDEILKS